MDDKLIMCRSANCDTDANKCCGPAGGAKDIAPVYANPSLMGCFVPRIPGVADPAPPFLEQDAYTCIETPAFVTNRATTSEDYGSKTGALGSATFVATATVTSALATESYINWGCYPAAPAVALVNQVVAPLTNVSAGSCIQACELIADRQGQWAGLSTKSGVSTCYCGFDLADSLGDIAPMSSCNGGCSGSAKENCGPSNGMLLYVNAVVGDSVNVAKNIWYSSSSTSWAKSSTYTCNGSKSPIWASPLPSLYVQLYSSPL